MNTALDYSDELELLSEIPWWVGDLLRDERHDRQFWVTKGLGSGGTYGTAIWHLLMCHINWESTYSWAIAPTFTQVFDTLVPTFLDVADKYFGWEEGRDFRIVRSGRPRMVLLATGQEIAFKSADRPERFVGPSISHVSGTEIGLWKRVAWEKSCARLRCPKAIRRQYVGEGTPEGVDHWWAEEANHEEGENPDPSKNARRLILWTDDNPHLPDGYIENQLVKVYGHDAAKLESYRYGTFTRFTKGTAYWEWFERRSKVSDAEASPSLPIVLTWDFNIGLAWVALQRQMHDAKGGRRYRWIALEESSGKSAGIERACAEFIARFDPEEFGDTPIEIDGDASGFFDSHKHPQSDYARIEACLRQYYTNVRVTAKKQNPEIEHRLQQVAFMMANETFVAASWCKNLCNGFGKTCLKPNSWDILKPAGDTWSHWADAVGYALFWRTIGEDYKGRKKKRFQGANVQV